MAQQFQFFSQQAVTAALHLILEYFKAAAEYNS